MIGIDDYEGSSILKSFKDDRAVELVKGMGKKDKSKLIPKKITDKTGKQTTVWVSPEQAKEAMDHAQKTHGDEWGAKHKEAHDQKLAEHHESNEKGKKKENKAFDPKNIPKMENISLDTPENQDGAEYFDKLLSSGWSVGEDLDTLLPGLNYELEKYKLHIQVGERGDDQWWARIGKGATAEPKRVDLEGKGMKALDSWMSSDWKDQEGLIKELHRDLQIASKGKLGFQWGDYGDENMWVKIKHYAI